MDIQAKINALKESIHASLTKDSSADDIKAVEDKEKALDEILTDVETLKKEKQEVTDLYIQASKNQGSKDAPSDEQKEKQPRSLEEIAQEVISKDKK